VVESAIQTVIRSVRASEAKTDLPRLRNEVECGETLVIRRHERAIARIVPETAQRWEEVAKTISGIVTPRRETGRALTRQILSARDEGREAWCSSFWTRPSRPAGFFRTKMNRGPRRHFSSSPALFWFEIRNILIVRQHQGSAARAATRSLLQSLASLAILVDSGPDEERAASQGRNQLTLRNLDKFSWIGLFSGATVQGDLDTAYNGVLKDAAAFNKRVHLLWTGAGTAEARLMDALKTSDELLTKRGIRHVNFVSEGTAHEWHSWRRHLNDFVPRVFK